VGSPLISAGNNFPADAAHLQTREREPLFGGFSGSVAPGRGRISGERGGGLASLSQVSRGGDCAIRSHKSPPPCPLLPSPCPYSSGGSHPAGGWLFGASVQDRAFGAPPPQIPGEPRPAWEQPASSPRAGAAGFGTQRSCGSRWGRCHLPDGPSPGCSCFQPGKTWADHALPRGMTGFTNAPASCPVFAQFTVCGPRWIKKPWSNSCKFPKDAVTGASQHPSALSLVQAARKLLEMLHVTASGFEAGILHLGHPSIHHCGLL
jgi:hypothetical protein